MCLGAGEREGSDLDFFLALVGLSCLGSLMLSWGRARVWKVASVSWRLRVLGGGQHPASPSHLMSLLSEAFLPPSPDSHWGRSLPPRTCRDKKIEGIYFMLLKVLSLKQFLFLKVVT